MGGTLLFVGLLGLSTELAQLRLQRLKLLQKIRQRFPGGRWPVDGRILHAHFNDRRQVPATRRCADRRRRRYEQAGDQQSAGPRTETPGMPHVNQ